MTRCYILFLILFGIGSSGSMGCDPQANNDAGSILPLETAVRYNSSHDFFELDTEQKRVNKATGALYCPQRDTSGQIKRTAAGNEIRGTCGLTFISPHYAITDDHCVDRESCGRGDITFKVRQFDISGLDISKQKEKSKLQNVNDANFENWEFGGYLTPADGYKFTEYDCEVTALCENSSDANEQLSAEICNIDGSRFSDDIALIHCPGRDNSAAYVDLADSVAVGDPVRMHWFYEITNLPLPHSCNTSACANANEFYNERSSQKHNFHYIGFDANRETQLLPLVSVPWDASEQRESFLTNNNNAEPFPKEHVILFLTSGWAKTDIWGCHGMSGSGIFQIGADGEERLIAPVRYAGNDSDLGNSMCESVNAMPGAELIIFGTPENSRALATWALDHETE